MISVLLTILKILGIILLVILGLVLLILLLVLFVPFRYRVRADGEDKVWDAQAAFGWLGYLIQGNVTFHEKKLRIFAKAFGIKVYDTGEKELGKKKKDEEASAEAPREETAETPKPENEETTVTEAESEAADANANAEQPPSRPEEATEETTDEALEITEETEEEMVIGTEPVEEEDADIFADVGSGAQTGEETGEKPEKEIESIFVKIDRVYAAIDRILDKVEPVLEFLQEDDTQDLLGQTFRRLGRLLRHILPYALEGDLIVGTGDPVNTAKLQAAMSFLYPKLPKNFYFQSYFIDKKVAADLTMKGRIRIGSMVGIVLGLILKGYTFRTIKRVKALMSTLKEKPQEE